MFGSSTSASRRPEKPIDRRLRRRRLSTSRAARGADRVPARAARLDERQVDQIIAAREVIGVLKGAPERGEAAILYTADYLNLPLAHVRSAVSYYAAYPAEIDEWIARNDKEAEAAEAVWRREQAALA